MPKKNQNRKDQGNRKRISICLEFEVLDFFKKRAKDPNAAPYQTQINNELRKIMEREQMNEGLQEEGNDLQKSDLKDEILKDKTFLIKLKKTLKDV